MATVRVVVVDEDGNPQRGVTVAAYSLANFPDIVGRQETDDAGSTMFTLTGPVFFDAFNRRGVSMRDRNYPGKIQVQIVSFGGFACYDYVVDCSGFGTHESVREMMADFIAAAEATTDVVKTCWVCCDRDDDTNIPIGSNSSSVESATLIIESAGKLLGDNANGGQRVALRGVIGTAADAYFKVTVGSPSYTPHIAFRGLRLETRLSTGASAAGIAHGFIHTNATAGHGGYDFYDCTMSVGTTVNTNGVIVAASTATVGDPMAVRFFRCDGLAGMLYSHRNGADVGSLEVYDAKDLGCSQLVTDNNQALSALTLQGGQMYCANYFWNHTAGSSTTVMIGAGIRLFNFGSTTAFRTASGQIAAEPAALRFIVMGAYYGQTSTTNTVGFANLNASTVGSDEDAIFIDSFYGRADNTNTGTMIVIGTGWNKVHVGDIMSQNFTTSVTGGGSIISTPMKVAPIFEIEGNPDALNNTMQIIDSTGTTGSLIYWERSGVGKGSVGLWATSAPAPWGANDLIFGVNNGTERWPAAFSNDGSAFKLQTSLRIDGYGRVGSDFTAPANTTDGDFTAIRYFVNNDSAFSVAFSGVTPTVTFDTGDNLLYVRASNLFQMNVGGSVIANLSATQAGFLGYGRFGGITAPTNTNAGDLTFLRGIIGNASADITTNDSTVRAEKVLTNPSVATTLAYQWQAQFDATANNDNQLRVFAMTLLPNPSSTFAVTGQLEVFRLEQRLRGAGSYSNLVGGVIAALTVDSTSANFGTVTIGEGLQIKPFSRPSGNPTGTVTLARGLRIRNDDTVGSGPITFTESQGIVIEKLTQAATNIEFMSAGKMVYTPTTQTLAAVGNTIGSTARMQDIDNSTGALLTLTSTPSIVAGVSDGQLLTITNVDTADSVAIQDITGLAGSGARNPGAATLTLGPRDSVTYRWRAAASEWWAIATANL